MAKQKVKNVYDRMVSDDNEGVKPLYRQKSYQRTERRRAKVNKKHDWSSKGGYIAPIMVPSTPNGELASILRAVVEQEQSSGLKFKILETGGVTFKCRL